MQLQEISVARAMLACIQVDTHRDQEQVLWNTSRLMTREEGKSYDIEPGRHMIASILYTTNR